VDRLYGLLMVSPNPTLDVTFYADADGEDFAGFATLRGSTDVMLDLELVIAAARKYVKLARVIEMLEGRRDDMLRVTVDALSRVETAMKPLEAEPGHEK
jgi:hypothetical protein